MQVTAMGLRTAPGFSTRDLGRRRWCALSHNRTDKSDDTDDDDDGGGGVMTKKGTAQGGQGGGAERGNGCREAEMQMTGRGMA